LQNYTRRNRIQYLADILILIGLVIVCALLFGYAAKLFSIDIFKMSMDEFTAYLSDMSWFQKVENLKIYNVFSTFGAWMVSGFLLFKMRKYKTSEFWRFNDSLIPRTWLLLPFLFVSCIFVASFLLHFNQNIQIPERLKASLGTEASQKLLERMLEMHSSSDFLINLFVIALVPAIFEEIFFRGTLQPLMQGFTGNVHVGIVLSSLIFAAIHLNIMQIIPMFFLALVLGYLFYFTKSLLPGILVHFCNNGMAVMANYYRDTSSVAKKVAEDTYVPDISMVVLFTAILGGIFFYFYNQSKQITYE